MTKLLPLLLVTCGLAVHAACNADAKNPDSIRIATFNIAMGLDEPGALLERLQSGDDEGLKKVAAIIQRVRPDVLLLNEFDRNDLDASLLLTSQYLETSQFGEQPIVYPHSISGAVNTGVNSGFDLNNNGKLGEPEDAWGYGRFPGQYGMLVLSRLPMTLERNLRLFRWADMPDALNPINPDGEPWYPDHIRSQLRLSSKSHWDIRLNTDIELDTRNVSLDMDSRGTGESVADPLNTGKTIHLLVSHPTPPVFDGSEDRNGLRNHDEIRLWADYVDPARSGYIYSHDGKRGGLTRNAMFVIAGDLNADPADGDSHPGAIAQLLEHPLINANCQPLSGGALEASRLQAGKNLEHTGNPAADTADFNDDYAGNMRIDYVLPSATLAVDGCGVFWPAEGEEGHDWIDVSDHRLVWVDVVVPGGN